MEEVTVIADSREFNSKVVRHISLLGAKVVPKMLPVGDYLCSEEVAIERKTVDDFLKSLLDQRLFEQVETLKKNFKKPVVLIEGLGLYRLRNIHPNSINGALASIAVDSGVPILWTENENETASLVFWIAKREQVEMKKTVQIRGEKKASTVAKQQEFIAAGLPEVSTVLARRLLLHFGTLRSLFSTDEDELRKVEKIGEKKAKKIFQILNRKYEL